MDIGLNGTLAISASGLRAERLRLDTIASNLANASTTRTAEGGPYRRRNVIFVTQALESDFAATIEALAEEGTRRGVEVADVVEDPSPPRLVFDPAHPDANREGFVAYPNVNPVAEMVDLLAATRAYEANVQAVNATKRMADAALSIGG
jgi:flagellar basal-body rod protein FlgC